MVGEKLSQTKPLLHVAILGDACGDGNTLPKALAACAPGGSVRPDAVRRPPLRSAPAAPSVEYETARRRYALHDWSSEDALVRGLLERGTEWTGAVLVASARQETLAPAARRQVWLARQLRVPYVLAFVTRADAATRDRVDHLEAEVRLLLHTEGYPGDDVPVLRGDAWSALCSGGKDDRVCRVLRELQEAFDLHLRPSTPARELPFRLVVEETGSRKWGLFVAAVGRVEQGRVAVGDRVTVVAATKATPTVRVAHLRRFHRWLDFAEAGERVSVLVRQGRTPRLEPGAVLCKPGTVAAQRRFEAVLTRPPARTFLGGRPAFAGGSVRLNFGTHETTGRVWLAEGTPGDAVRVRGELDAGAPLGLFEGLRFDWRDDEHAGSGVVVRVV